MSTRAAWSFSKSIWPSERLLRGTILHNPAKSSTNLLNIIVADIAITVEIRSTAVARLSPGASIVVVGDDFEVSAVDATIVVEIVNANWPPTVGRRIKDKGALLAQASIRRFNPPDPIAILLGRDLEGPGQSRIPRPSILKLPLWIP
jgi:hypothetical protein